MTARPIFPMGNSIVFESRTLGSSRNLLGPRRRLGRGAPSDERQGHSPPEPFLSGRQMAGLYQGRRRRPFRGDLDGAGRMRPRPSAARQRRAIPASASFRVASGILPRWPVAAYSSSETRRNEVYVRPFSRAECARGGRSQISTAGDRFPIWERGAHGSGASCSSLVSMGAS